MEEDKSLTLEQYVTKYTPEGWEALFKDAKEEIRNISGIIQADIDKGIRVVPDMENIFRVFHLVKPSDVKVIIWGQDPYHQILYNGKPRAQGLSLSVSAEDDIPGSLLNIYKEIVNCYPEITKENFPKSGDLSNWVSQGVLLLNSCLTCKAGEPGSHSKYIFWHPFINKLLTFLAKYNKDIIHVLWGKEAQKLEKMISVNFKIMLIGPHPSGLSAYRGFMGCGHFKKINDLLETQKRPQIKWM